MGRDDIYPVRMSRGRLPRVRKCEELYDMSNKKCSDNDWKEKLWGQVGEEFKKSMFFIANFEVNYHSIITEVLIINK